MIQIWGHRGAKAYSPENTMASFEEAYRQDADGIELDVHLSKDGYLMVCHDERVDRTSDGRGLIKDMTCKQLKKLDFGAWFNKDYAGTRIPVLDEVLEFLQGNSMMLNVEIKAGSIFYPKIEECIIDRLSRYGMKDRTVISSFDHYALKRIKEIDPGYKTGILYEARLYQAVEYMKTIGADMLHPYFISVTPELIAEAAQNNVPINTYLINNVTATKRLARAGVNAIITDFPKDIISVLTIDTASHR